MESLTRLIRDEFIWIYFFIKQNFDLGIYVCYAHSYVRMEYSMAEGVMEGTRCTARGSFFPLIRRAFTLIIGDKGRVIIRLQVFNAPPFPC